MKTEIKIVAKPKSSEQMLNESKPANVVRCTAKISSAVREAIKAGCTDVEQLKALKKQAEDDIIAERV